MSAFSESALVKKLLELNSSQQSIQTLSLWLIHHRKHYASITKTWFKELQKVSQSKKLTFMYLANDVIQNSKKKGPEYGKEFELILTKAFLHISDTCSEVKIITSLDRILNIWSERGVYDVGQMLEYRSALHKKIEGNGEKKRSSSNKDDASSSSSSSKKSRLSLNSSKEHVKSETIEINGTVETHVTLSPHTPAGEPPEPEELIKAVLDLENSASSDAFVRERIASLPPEVSEIALLNKLEDKESAAKLAIQVNEAVKLLNDYNLRLATEMDDRKKLTNMLKDFQQEQKELLSQSEQRLEDYSAKLQKIKEVQKEIRSHLHNLPDLTQLPDATGGLAPLPSAGDLFNTH